MSMRKLSVPHPPWVRESVSLQICIWESGVIRPGQVLPFYQSARSTVV